MSPNLGCYGDPDALTPNIDRFATGSVRYTRAFATAPVCSPSRSTLITGVYATSLNTQNLRSHFPIPENIKGFPTYLRDAGYYCSNNSKTDYNVGNEQGMIKASWNESSGKAHWRKRPPGAPFFSVFNLMETHQGRASASSFAEFEKFITTRLTSAERHDAGNVQVPPYYPDTPTVRRTLARYHDCITAMDKQVGRILKELEQDGLADTTIVFFYSDHGAGLPRAKRVVYDSGLHVPLLVRFPKKFEHLAPAAAGQTTGRLVSFVDFAPTVLSIAGVTIPSYMPGQPFLGKAAAPRQFVYGARDRVDEAFDLSRSVRDDRFLYIRNYMPHLSWNQPEGYSDQSEMRREITRLAVQGKLNAVQLTYAGPTRPIEELYDTDADPHQVHNLATSKSHRAVLEKMRAEHRRWIVETRDAAFVPEAELWLRMNGSTPWAMARENRYYPQQRIVDAADLVGRPDAVREQTKLLSSDSDSAIRYWAAVGLHAAEKKAAPARDALTRALEDSSASVRIEAAAALVRLGGKNNRAFAVLTKELQGDQPDSVVHAARTLQLLGEKALPALPAMQQMLARSKTSEQQHAMYVRFCLEPAAASLQR